MTVYSNDARFAALVRPDARLERLFGGLKWVEGPVWFEESGTLLVSDIPNDRMLRWRAGSGVDVFRAPSNFANGNTRDREGRLVTCEHGTRRVTRTEPDGGITVLAERHEGRRLNSPNDVVVKSDGSIWFTDPPYGILSDYEGHRADSELGANYVFRLEPKTGRLDIVADDFDKPNGLAFSPDERLLYVADSGMSHTSGGPHHIKAFEVAGGRLTPLGVFAVIEPGTPDGIRTDPDGNLWSSAADGVHVFTPDATLLGRILVPETVSNLCFGDGRLFITATTSVYSIVLA